MRLERQTREHQAALAEADQRLLQTQEELDKVRTNGRRRGVEGEIPQESALDDLACSHWSKLVLGYY